MAVIITLPNMGPSTLTLGISRHTDDYIPATDLTSLEIVLNNKLHPLHSPLCLGCTTQKVLILFPPSGQIKYNLLTLPAHNTKKNFNLIFKPICFQ
jgi:hypothetical protein